MDQTWSGYEVLLVDNASSDGSVEYVRRSFPSVRIIENRINLGSAGGDNSGLRVARGDFVILLNNDTRVPRDFVEVLVRSASIDPGLGSVGCKVVQEDGTVKYGPIYSNNGFLVPLFLATKSRLEGLFNTEGYCIANCGAAVLYRRKALQVIGYHDADFWSDWEDHDLGYRLCLAGYKNLYTTRTSVIHVGGGSFGYELSKARHVRIIRNMLFTYLKNYDAFNVATRFLLLLYVILPLRHLLSISLREMIRLKNRSSQRAGLVSRQTYLSLPEAYISFLRGLRTTIRKRATVQLQREVPDSLIFSLTNKGWII